MANIYVNGAVSQSGFDYSVLSPNEAAAARDAAENIRSYQEATVASLSKMGETLLGIKDSLGHGRWGAWLSAEFGWSQDTAERYINLYRNLGDKIRYSARVRNLSPTVLYKLAAPAADSVRAEIVTKIERGASLDARAINDLIQRGSHLNYLANKADPDVLRQVELPEFEGRTLADVDPSTLPSAALSRAVRAVRELSRASGAPHGPAAEGEQPKGLGAVTRITLTEVSKPPQRQEKSESEDGLLTDQEAAAAGIQSIFKEKFTRDEIVVLAALFCRAGEVALTLDDDEAYLGLGLCEWSSIRRTSNSASDAASSEQPAADVDDDVPSFLLPQRPSQQRGRNRGFWNRISGA